MKKFKIYIKKPKVVEEPQKPRIASYMVGQPKQQKFWKPENLLGEIIEPEQIDVEVLKKKDMLCPKIWDESEEMYPEIREYLLKNALEFIKFAKLEGATFNDIILTGSLANYNWHSGSDLDVHIVMDFNQISDDAEFVDDYFRTKKALWGEKMPVQIKGHDVELYIQNSKEPHTSTGIYSIWKNKWLTKPIKEMIGIDTNNIQKKAVEFMKTIDDVADAVDSNHIAVTADKLMDKLKNYRKAGLEDGGEFSTENLVFKILRNTGYLEKLSELKYGGLRKELTLEGMVNEESLKEKLQNILRNTTMAFGFAVAGLALNFIDSDSLRQVGIDDTAINKAERYLQSLGSAELENVILKSKQFTKYLNKKLNDIDDEILN